MRRLIAAASRPQVDSPAASLVDRAQQGGSSPIRRPVRRHSARKLMAARSTGRQQRARPVHIFRVGKEAQLRNSTTARSTTPTNPRPLHQPRGRRGRHRQVVEEACCRRRGSRAGRGPPGADSPTHRTQLGRSAAPPPLSATAQEPAEDGGQRQRRVHVPRVGRASTAVPARLVHRARGAGAAGVRRQR